MSASLRRLAGRRPGIVFATTLVLLYLVGGPLLMLVVSSLKAAPGRLPFEPGVPFSLSNYADVLLSAETYQLLGVTLLFAAGSLALAFVISIGLAWLVERTDLPFRGAVFVLVVASSAMPGVISGIAWVLLLNPTNGWVNVFLRHVTGSDAFRGPIDAYTIPVIILVQGLTLVPITFLLISSSFRAMNAALEDAATASGARYSTVFRRVTLPLMTPALLGALVYLSVTAVESFDIPLVLGLPGNVIVLSTRIYSEVHPPEGFSNYGLASTYGFLLLGLAVLPLLIYNYIVGRSPERFATIVGRSYKASRIALGPLRTPLLLVVAAYLFLTFLLPFVVMVWMSVQPFVSVPSPESMRRITLSAYQAIWADPRTGKALFNTVLLGTAAGLIAMAIAFVTSWVVLRSRTRLAPWIDLLAFAPHAMPGIVIGLSVALIYLLLPIPIYNTIWIIVVAVATQQISFGTRLMNAALVQVHAELEDAAYASGASMRALMTRVIVPLVLPALVNGFLLTFLAGMKNLTLTLMLYSADSTVMATLIYHRWVRGDTAATAALGVITSVMTVAVAILVRRYAVRGLA